MKTLARFLFIISVFIFSSTLFGQISNLLVNGSSTDFSMESGSLLSWSYNLPVGDTATLEIWIDINGSSIIEPETDVLWQSFYQIDGRSDLNGPPDMDGLINGEIIFAQEVGLAPAEYIMSFSNNESTATIAGIVTPITSPTFIISGNVTVPNGQSAQYLTLSLENSSRSENKFWNAITDANGDFSVQMDADTSGNPWRLSVDNVSALNPAIVSPDNILLTLDAGITTTYTGNNFIFTEAAAEINGTVTDDGGNLLIGADVYLNSSNGNLSRYTKTDQTGTYRIGFLSDELPASNIWIGSGNSDNMNIVSAVLQLPVINSGDIITRNLTVYQTNSTITGVVTLDGNPPNMNLEMYAIVSDTGYVRTYTDLNGNYILNVSDKLFNYDIRPGQLPNEYFSYSITAHPGQTDVNFNFTITDVEQDPSGTPGKFSLSQNFPNPFNPSTVISYQLPVGGQVSLKVYDILGNEVSTLVNKFQTAGKYNIDFKASLLPSGIYFYRLQTGSFVETRKMILLQ